MNDQESFEHTNTGFCDMGKHLAVKMNYSGKNAFGSRVKSWIKAKISLNGEISQIIQATRVNITFARSVKNKNAMHKESIWQIGCYNGKSANMLQLTA